VKANFIAFTHTVLLALDAFRDRSNVVHTTGVAAGVLPAHALEAHHARPTRDAIDRQVVVVFRAVVVKGVSSTVQRLALV
jgi:hypothetical protein